ncbi:GNAT family N-acetyltransferase [Halorhabdus amylolytica]|uniref:GNAT family N-acetyltransferase n=1 Tax=Halorhabdus amylolytica TaxID=2559573 RepID=UPI0020BF945F|nr:GNAT family N-acetyltransferase [Halorhabdus amylolytica]
MIRPTRDGSTTRQSTDVPATKLRATPTDAPDTPGYPSIESHTTIGRNRSYMEGSLGVATPEDASAIRSIYAPYVEATPITFETGAPTRAEMAARIETTREQYPWLVYESREETILGYATAGPLRSMGAYEWTAELTVYVAEDARRSGIGTALYTALLELLTEQGYYNAAAAVTLPNPASVQLHEKHGFEPVGTFPAVGNKDGEWHDVQWWYRQLTERPADPSPPEPFSVIEGSPAFERALEADKR